MRWSLFFNVPNPLDARGKPTGGAWRPAGEADDDHVEGELANLQAGHGAAIARRGRDEIVRRRTSAYRVHYYDDPDGAIAADIIRRAQEDYERRVGA